MALSNAERQARHRQRIKERLAQADNPSESYVTVKVQGSRSEVIKQLSQENLDVGREIIARDARIAELEKQLNTPRQSLDPSEHYVKANEVAKWIGERPGTPIAALEARITGYVRYTSRKRCPHCGKTPAQP